MQVQPGKDYRDELLYACAFLKETNITCINIVNWCCWLLISSSQSYIPRQLTPWFTTKSWHVSAPKDKGEANSVSLERGGRWPGEPVGAGVPRPQQEPHQGDPARHLPRHVQPQGTRLQRQRRQKGNCLEFLVYFFFFNLFFDLSALPWYENHKVLRQCYLQVTSPSYWVPSE